MLVNHEKQVALSFESGSVSVSTLDKSDEKIWILDYNGIIHF